MDPYNMVTRDAQIALNEFSMQFDGAFTASEALRWSERFGVVNSSRAIRTTYPIPISAAGYNLREGDDKYRNLYERSMSMSPVQWQDGVEAQAIQLEAPDFLGWSTQPEDMAREARRHPNLLVADMLTANPYLDFYRIERPGGSVASTRRLFAADHPYNVLDDEVGTFSNDKTATGINEDFVKAAKLSFRSRLAANGKNLGLRFTTLLVPAALEQQALDFFQSDTLILAVQNVAGDENVGGVPTNNRHKGTVEVVVCDELNDTNIMYALDEGATAKPWVIQTGGTPEEIVFDKSSDYYKRTAKLAIGRVLLAATAAMLPQAIERYTIT